MTPAELAAQEVARFTRPDAVGADAPPGAFTFPSEGEYATQLVRALDQVVPLVNASAEDLSPPVMAHVTAVVATLEGTTGMPFGKLVELAGAITALANATSPAAIVEGIRDLISGTLAVAMAVAKTAGATTSAFKAVPVIGAFVDAMLGIVVAILDSQARYAEAQQICEERGAAIMNAACSKAVTDARPSATSSAGPTAADLFRPFAYLLQSQERYWQLVQQGGGLVAQRRPHLPMNAASVYVVLCGDALPDALRVTKQDDRWRSHKSGIPRATRQRMWSCIRALCAAAERPGITGRKMQLDGGGAVMPILQELVRTAYLREQLTDADIKSAADIVAGSLFAEDHCDDLTEGEIAAGARTYYYASCKGRVDLVEPFVEGIVHFEKRLLEEFTDDEGRWTIGPKTALSKAPAQTVSIAPGMLSTELAGRLAKVSGTKAALLRPMMLRRKASFAPAAFGIGVLALIIKFLL